MYDRRAIVVEVVSRLHALQAATAANRPQHELQVAIDLVTHTDAQTEHMVYGVGWQEQPAKVLA